MGVAVEGLELEGVLLLVLWCRGVVHDQFLHQDEGLDLDRQDAADEEAEADKMLLWKCMEIKCHGDKVSWR